MAGEQRLRGCLGPLVLSVPEPAQRRLAGGGRVLLYIHFTYVYKIDLRLWKPVCGRDPWEKGNTGMSSDWLAYVKATVLDNLGGPGPIS